MTTREQKPDLSKVSSECHYEETRDDESATEIARLKQTCAGFDTRIREIENRKPPASFFDAFNKHPYLITIIMICLCIVAVVFICYQKQDIIYYVDRSIDLFCDSTKSEYLYVPTMA